ncbi:MAG TPA: hypothetical protein VK986_00530, partial [Tepidisphaeraceae bacterium]|nr:hypothetical protein [Tepidisphaeraceae bacterium]
MAWLERRNDVYRVCWRDGAGKVKRVKAYSDKLASKAMMAKLEQALARGEQGLVDPVQAAPGPPPGRPRQGLRGGPDRPGRDPMYVYTCTKRLDKLIAACGWRVLGDVTADSFCQWRETPVEAKQTESATGTVGPVTLNQYLEVVRSFCRWCVKRKRLAANPVADVEKVETSGDIRRERRALSEDDLVRFFAALSADHRRVYLFLLATGLRRQEVEDLRWGDLHLAATVPYVRLRAKATKSRRADSLPLKADVAAELATVRG